MTVALKNASGSMSPLFSSTMLAQGEERNQWCQSQGLFRSPTAEKAKGEDRAMTRMVNVSGREGGGGQKRRIKKRNLLFKSFHRISLRLGPTLPSPLWTFLT